MKPGARLSAGVTLGGVACTLRPMTRADREALLALARSIPEHDQLFLRRDITRPEVVDRWIAELEAGELATVLAERGGADRRLRDRAARPRHLVAARRRAARARRARARAGRGSAAR